MSQLKGIFSFFSLLLLLSAPGLVLYKSPQEKKINMKPVKAPRGIASLGNPATKRCETVKRVRWRCQTVDGKKDCHRDGFETVRHCEPLKKIEFDD